MKRSERTYPEDLMNTDFQTYQKSDKYKNLSLLLPNSLIHQIFKQAWWDGRASQFNLKKKEEVKEVSY